MILNKLKIGYFADGPWSHNSFKKIISDNTLKIQFVVPRKNTIDNTLKNLAKINNIDYITPVDVNSESFYELAKTYSCDLFVSMSFNQIFKKKIMNLPRLKTINCHAGKLPFYRGRNILNWVLINDEKEFGITVHYINEGIDTGDIILQRTFPITDDDSYNSLLNRSYSECSKILFDAIKLVQKGNFKVIKQNKIDKNGSYFRKRVIGDENINWNNNSRYLFNFIRAISYPGPKATTYLDDNEVKINSSRIISNDENFEGHPGEILKVNDNSLIVKTFDGVLKIQDIQTNIKILKGNIFK